MDVVGNCLRFQDYFSGDEALTPRELLHAELKMAELAGLGTLTKMICRQLFGHADPLQLADNQVERFVATIDPMIMAAMSKHKAGQ